VHLEAASRPGHSLEHGAARGGDRSRDRQAEPGASVVGPSGSGKPRRRRRGSSSSAGRLGPVSR